MIFNKLNYKKNNLKCLFTFCIMRTALVFDSSSSNALKQSIFNYLHHFFPPNNSFRICLPIDSVDHYTRQKYIHGVYSHVKN